MENASQVLPYLLTVIGFLAVFVLNGIKSEIKEVKITVKALESDLRGGVTELDRRLTKLETKCDANHAH